MESHASKTDSNTSILQKNKDCFRKWHTSTLNEYSKLFIYIFG